VKPRREHEAPQIIAERLDQQWDEIAALVPTMADCAADGGDEAYWKALVLEVAQELASYKPSIVHKGKLLKQLSGKKAQAESFLESLDRNPDLDSQIDSSRLRAELGKYIRRVERLSPKPDEVRRSGGGSDKRLYRAVKRQAAEKAFELLFEMDISVMLSHDSSYVRLTEIFFYLATGREADDVFAACSEVLKKMDMSREDRTRGADIRE
jgi:hypothetical protein